MAEFDKEEYWTRRNNAISVTDKSGKTIQVINRPLRGQTNDVDLIKPVDLTKEFNSETGRPKYRLHYNAPNRKNRRQKVNNPKFTKRYAVESRKK
jgi:hypothetical protein